MGSASLLLAGCEAPLAETAGGWVGGAHAERGHRLRAEPPKAGDGPLRRTQVLIIGAGVSGLACARGLSQAGIADFALLELEDEVGGNSRAHKMGGMVCPTGAHYLPLPGPHSHEVYQLLEELGLVRQRLGRPVWDERHLCHSPQERLFFDAAWHDGLLPPAQTASAQAQQRLFERAVEAAQAQLGFAMPTRRAPWTPGHAALDGQSFAAWLTSQGLSDPHLRWYLDYCCRDDYGAGLQDVSAWAGLHYFASRHGFHPAGSSAEREAVLTWPQGNAFLTDAIAAPVTAQIHRGRSVLRVESGKHQVELLVWNEARQSAERWQAEQLVLATPLFIANKLLGQGLAPLKAAAEQMRYAPWLVANLQLKGPLLQRSGAPPAWDNVIYASQGLGYVDAMHQSLKPQAGATVLSAYWALPQARRGELLRQDWRHWLRQILADLMPVHPDLLGQIERADLVRWGHAMSIPVPGLRGSAALSALQQPQGRLHFAHSDLAGYSVFEEAYTQGFDLASKLAARLGRR
ncbi:flavin monoamine oxidase family protein [Roseateles oligotrophus]|uniref:FAD-dependent oxidoreductase n=1 Tax=Roseateles oligotrophus TaxID=1769250 RepID=A0ABT2YBX3_9BURK|nr:FAD-dependent oxidoreductase [Roseateles oligotrophus]MCV2366890.1 FAD-dependent oxidoreductase [Roseateles oligotrophus]